MSFRTVYRIVIFSLIVSCFATHAADRYWVATAPGFWKDSANWSATPGGIGGALPPGSADDAHFGGATASCTINANAAAHHVEVSAGYQGILFVGSGATLTAWTLNCDSTMELLKSSQLVLLGPGEPLTGWGHVNTTEHSPNTIEYRGGGALTLTSATPISAYSNLTLTAPGGISEAGLLASVNPAEVEFDSAAIDVTQGFAYFGTFYANPGTVVKVRLSDFKQVASLTLNSGEMDLSPSFIYQGYLYAGTRTTPGQIVKIRLSDFTRVGALTLNPGEDQLWTSALDDTKGIAYFGTRTTPGHVVKIDLNTFTRVGALALDPAEGEVFSSAIDTTGGYLYAGTRSAPGKIVRIRLADFTRVDALSLQAGEDNVSSALIDRAHGYAYFSTHTAPAKIIRVRLSDFTRSAALTFQPGEDPVKAALLDSKRGFAYFGTDNFPGKIVKVDLTRFVRSDVLTLGIDEGGLLYSVIDPVAGCAYFPTDHWTGNILKVNLNATETVWTHQNPLQITGNLTIGAGTLNSIGNGIAIGGNWTNAGVYSAGQNTVTLNGANQRLSGNNQFYNLSKTVTAAATLTVDSGRLLQIDGALTLAGAPGKLIRMAAFSSGSPFQLLSSNYQFAHYAAVKDVDASLGRPLTVFSGVNSGGNQNVLFAAPDQLTVNTPAASLTSPAWVEGVNGADVSSITVSVNGGAPLPARTLGATDWYADTASSTGAPPGVLLSPTAATQVVVTASAGTLSHSVTQSIAWTPTDMKGWSDSGMQLTLRKGDALLLTDSEPGTALTIDTAGGAAPATFTGKPGELFSAQFSIPGNYLVTATVTKADSSSVQHFLNVRVLAVNFNGPVAAELGFARSKTVLITGGSSADVNFSSTDPFVLTVGLTGPVSGGTKLYLKPQRLGAASIAARAGGATGPLISAPPVDIFQLEIRNREGGVIDLETGEACDSIVMRPYVANLDFTFEMFAHTTTFAGGATKVSVNSSTFSTDAVAHTGTYFLEMQVPPGETMSCYSIRVYQGTADVEELNFQTVNATKCGFDIPVSSSIRVKRGETKVLHILGDKANKTNHKKETKHKLELMPFNTQKAAGDIGIDPNTFDCLSASSDSSGNLIWDANITPAASAAAVSYDAVIDGKPHFPNRVVVLRACEFDISATTAPAPLYFKIPNSKATLTLKLTFKAANDEKTETLTVTGAGKTLTYTVNCPTSVGQSVTQDIDAFDLPVGQYSAQIAGSSKANVFEVLPRMTLNNALDAVSRQADRTGEVGLTTYNYIVAQVGVPKETFTNVVATPVDKQIWSCTLVGTLSASIVALNIYVPSDLWPAAEMKKAPQDELDKWAAMIKKVQDHEDGHATTLKDVIAQFQNQVTTVTAQNSTPETAAKAKTDAEAAANTEAKNATDALLKKVKDANTAAQAAYHARVGASIDPDSYKIAGRE